MYSSKLPLTLSPCCKHSCLDTWGGRAPPCPPSSARLVWCVSSCRAAFAFLFVSIASPLLSARSARAGRSAHCARCSGTVPAAPRAARCASGSSSCCTAHRASPHDYHCLPQPLGFQSHSGQIIFFLFLCACELVRVCSFGISTGSVIICARGLVFSSYINCLSSVANQTRSHVILIFTHLFVNAWIIVV